MPNKNKTKSEGLTVDNELQDKKVWNPNKEQLEILAFYTKRIESARSQRAQNRDEFDGLTYQDDYELNKRAGNAYLPPRLNENEVRIVTGTTEKKIETVWNELLGMNLQSEINAYDTDDNFIKELGNDFNDVVNRTNQIERDDDFYKEAIREMLVQRAVFIQEVDEHLTYIKKTPTKISDEGDTSHTEGTVTTYNRPRKKLISGLQVYLGDMSIPFYRFQEQPYIVLYFRKTYDEARAQYQGWKNWEFVTKGAWNSDIRPDFYRMNDINDEEVEEIHIIDPWNNEYMIMINGVMMFEEPVACPWEVLPDRRYNMIMVAIKPMGTDFAYGKCLAASAKTLQGLNSETIRLLIKKFRQSVQPALGTKGKKIFSSDIYDEGSVTNGIKEGELFRIDPNQSGVTSAEFNVFDLIEKKTEEFIGAGNTAQGVGQKGEQTATEVLNQQKQFIKMLGMSVVSLMVMKRESTYQRLYNLLENYTKSTGKKLNPVTEEIDNLFRKFTNTEGVLSNGKKGKKVVQFIDRPLESVEKESVFNFENREERLGRPTKFRFVNVTLLSKIPMLWFVTVNQKERDGSALEKVMFTEKLNQGVAISELIGRPMNPDKLIEDYETTYQAKNMFQEAPPQQAGGQQAGAGEVSPQEMAGLDKQISGLDQGKIGDQLKEGAVAGQTNAPSLNTMEGQVA